MPTREQADLEAQELNARQEKTVAAAAKKARQNAAFMEAMYVKTVDMSIALKHVYPFKFTSDGTPEIIGNIEPKGELSFISEEALAKLPKRAMVRSIELSLGVPGRQLLLPTGVVVVMGRSGAGKSYLSYHQLHRLNSDRGLYISIDELETATELIYENSKAATTEVDLVVHLSDALFDPAYDYIIVDSFRYLFYETTGGAAGKGGVNMGLFMKLTRLANLAAKVGKTIIVIINPMTDDEQAYGFYKEAAMGAVNAVISVESPSKASITSRVAKTRDWTSLSLPRVGPSNDEIISATIKASQGRAGLGRLLNDQ